MRAAQAWSIKERGAGIDSVETTFQTRLKGGGKGVTLTYVLAACGDEVGELEEDVREDEGAKYLDATELHAAAFGGRADCCEKLVARGDAVDARLNTTNWTPMHVAAQGGNAAVVEYLLGQGGTRTPRRRPHARPAAEPGRPGPGRLHGPARGRAGRDVWKSTSVSVSLSLPATTWPRWLRRAVRNRHRHAIEQVSRRWRGGRRDDSARTRRILISTQAGSLATVRLLLDAGADLEAESDEKSPLFVAVRQKRCDIASALLEKGADAGHCVASAGLCPIHAATSPDRLACLTALLAHGADPNAFDAYGTTPLRVAAIKGDEMGIINADIIEASSRPAPTPRWTQYTRGSRTTPRPRAPRRRDGRDALIGCLCPLVINVPRRPKNGKPRRRAARAHAV